MKHTYTLTFRSSLPIKKIEHELELCVNELIAKDEDLIEIKREKDKKKQSRNARLVSSNQAPVIRPRKR